jgi:hypothetical protein
VIAALATAGVFVASSTSYCPGSSSSVMADGTHTRLGSAASNRHPLGTRLRLIGARWGRRRVRYRVLHPRASAASSRGRRSGGGGS